MKKLIKVVLTVVGLAACLEIANRSIFELARRTHPPRKRNGERVYNWRFGRVRYIVAGPVDAPPLLLVHGVGMGAGLHEWEEVLLALSRHYRVYALDLLGFGQSEKPAVSVSAYLYSLLIHDFAKNVIGEETFVVANNLSCSFAAVAAQMDTGAAYAPQSYRHPNEYIKKLLFLAPQSVQQTAPTRKQVWCKKLLDCPIIGTSIYLAMTSRVLLKAYLEKFGLMKAATTAQVDAFYAAAHHGGANARYPMSSFLTNFLYVETDRAIEAVTQPTCLLDNDGESGLYAHIQNPKALYQACRKFFG